MSEVWVDRNGDEMRVGQVYFLVTSDTAAVPLLRVRLETGRLTVAEMGELRPTIVDEEAGHGRVEVLEVLPAATPWMWEGMEGHKICGPARYMVPAEA